MAQEIERIEQRTTLTVPNKRMDKTQLSALRMVVSEVSDTVDAFKNTKLLPVGIKAHLSTVQEAIHRLYVAFNTTPINMKVVTTDVCNLTGVIYKALQGAERTTSRGLTPMTQELHSFATILTAHSKEYHTTLEKQVEDLQENVDNLQEMHNELVETCRKGRRNELGSTSIRVSTILPLFRILEIYFM